MTRVVNIESPLHAKIKTILFDLEVALNNSFLSLMIESDSLLAIQEITKQLETFSVWEGIFSDIIGFSVDCSFCTFTHIRRSANGLAHNLAKLCFEVGTHNNEITIKATFYYHMKHGKDIVQSE